MKILHIAITQTSNYDGEIVQVRVLNSRNERALIHVPITDEIYKQNIDCTIYTSNGPLILGKLNKDFFDNYTRDMEKVIKAVDSFLELSEEERSIDPFQYKET